MCTVEWWSGFWKEDEMIKFSRKIVWKTINSDVCKYNFFLTSLHCWTSFSKDNMIDFILVSLMIFWEIAKSVLNQHNSSMFLFNRVRDKNRDLLDSSSCEESKQHSCRGYSGDEFWLRTVPDRVMKLRNRYLPKCQDNK